jgi:hypothetical protein
MFLMCIVFLLLLESDVDVAGRPHIAIFPFEYYLISV